MATIKYGSVDHGTLLTSGYGMTKEEAEKIIAEREKDPQLWPFEMYQKARAFLAALKAKPEVISTRPGWKRKRR